MRKFKNLVKLVDVLDGIHRSSGEETVAISNAKVADLPAQFHLPPNPFFDIALGINVVSHSFGSAVSNVPFFGSGVRLEGKRVLQG